MPDRYHPGRPRGDSELQLTRPSLLSFRSTRVVHHVIAVVVLVLLTSSCTAAPPRPHKVVNLSSALIATKGSGSALVAFDFDQTLGAAGQVVHFTGTYDFQTMTGQFTTESPIPATSPTPPTAPGFGVTSTTTPQTTGFGAPTTAPSPFLATMAKTTLIVSPTGYFVSLPNTIAAQVGGKGWARFQLSFLTASAGQSGFTTLQQALLDPRLWWPILGTVTRVKLDGKGILDGSPVTIYSATANLIAAANAAGPFMPVLDKAVSGMQGGLLPANFEIDQFGRLRQVSLAMSFPLSSSPTSFPPLARASKTTVPHNATATVDAVMTFASFGVPTHVSLPVQADTIPISEVLAAAARQPNPASISPPPSGSVPVP